MVFEVEDFEEIERSGVSLKDLRSVVVRGDKQREVRQFGRRASPVLGSVDRGSAGRGSVGPK